MEDGLWAHLLVPEKDLGASLELCPVQPKSFPDIAFFVGGEKIALHTHTQFWELPASKKSVPKA